MFQNIILYVHFLHDIVRKGFIELRRDLTRRLSIKI